MKPPTKQQVLDLLGLLAVITGTAAGFAIGGPFGSEVIAALGIELGGSSIRRRSLKLRERWLSSDDGVLNHDIQKALARAFVNAFANLETRYFDLPQAAALSKEERKYIKELFRQLKEQTRPGFLESLEQITQEQVVKDYLYTAPEAAAEQALWQQIDGTNVLPTESEDFKEFLRENLFVELQFWFGEELKTDNKESNKAWRAFQRLLMEGIRAEVEAVRSSQDQTEQDLRKIQQYLQKLASFEDQLEQLRDVVDHRLPDEPFQQGLEEAVDQLGTRLKEMDQTLRRVDQTTQRTEEKVDAALDLLRYGPGIEHHAAFINTAPPMPPNFVPRREELDELRQAVIGDRNTGPVALTGLRGMGGIGKTALAIALCHDEGLQEIFPDGVVWVDVGREPGNLAGKMRRVGQALGDGPGYYDTPEAGADRLRVVLKEKAVLLVLDDVWDARHVEPFLVEAPRCRVLFTTRNAGIALGLGARETPLGVLSPEQAISLLREWTGRGEPVFPEIADRLSYLPLALKLAGARLRGGLSGAEWLEAFQSISQMKLSRRSTDPQENLLRSFELSVRELSDEESDEDRRLYYALGIFPEDARMPQSVVARLWRQLSPDLTRFDCDELVTELAQLALIERNADDKCVTLHDLLREYTREQLGEELAATHAALLSAYNPDGKPWPQIEHDGYLYNHLAYHLREAGRTEELYKLLAGSPDWMEAKFVACTGDAAYVADLDLAIGDFADPLLDPYAVLELVKLYTARQAVNERVSQYTDTDLKTLLWLGREDEALTHTRLRSEPKDKFDGLLIAYRTLKEKGQLNLSLLDEAKEVAHGIPKYMQRSEAMSSLAEAVAQAGNGHQARELFDETAEVARRRPDELVSLLEAMARAEDERRAGELFDEAREAARSTADHRERSGALSFLAEAMAQAGDGQRARELFDEAREAARSTAHDYSPPDAGLIQDAVDSLREGFISEDEAREAARRAVYDHERPDALGLLEMVVQSGLLYEDEVQIITRNISKYRRRLEALALNSLVETMARARLFDEARDVAHTIELDYLRSKGLSSLAEAMVRAGLFEEAAEAVRSIPDNEQRLNVLRNLAELMARAGDERRAGELFDEAREVVRSIADRGRWSEALGSVTGLTARLGRFDEATEVAHNIELDYLRSDALGSLAEEVAGTGDKRRARELFDEATEVAYGIGMADWKRQRKTLRSLVRSMARLGLFDEATEVAHHIGWEDERISALGFVAETMARAGLFYEAAEAARSIPDHLEPSKALRSIAEVMARSGVFDEATEVAHSIAHDYSRSMALRDISAAMAKAGLFDEAREIAYSIPDFRQRSEALSSLTEQMARAGLVAEATEVTRNIPDNEQRSNALGSLAEKVAGTGDGKRARELFDKATEAAHSIALDYLRSGALGSLAEATVRAGDKQRAEEMFDEARDIADIARSGRRPGALWHLSAAMARAGLFDEAKEVVHSIEFDFSRSRALRDISAAMAKAGLFNEAQGIAHSIADWKRESEALGSLVEAMARAGLFDEARKVARRIPDDDERLDALSGLAVAAARAGYGERARELFDEAKEVDRRRPGALVSLVEAMARSGLFDEAREAARSIADDDERLAALNSLVAALTQARCFSFNYALHALGLRKFDEFLQTLAGWAPLFEEVAPRLSLDVLREATGIAGWVRSDWREIHEFLNS